MVSLGNRPKGAEDGLQVNIVRAERSTCCHNWSGKAMEWPDPIDYYPCSLYQRVKA